MRATIRLIRLFSGYYPTAFRSHFLPDQPKETKRERLRIYFLFLPGRGVALLILASALRALGGPDPILLGETLTEPIGGTWGGSVSVVPTIIGMQFFIATQEPFKTVTYSNGTYLQVDETKLAETVGGNLFFSQGQTGVYDFNATNCQAFQSIAATLTDGTNGPFVLGGFGYNSDRIITGGGTFGGSETAVWQLQTGQDFAGYTIKFFRLNVTATDWGMSNNFFVINGVSQWQVYGFPPPSIRPQLQLYPTVLDAYLLTWPTQSVGFVLQSGPDITSAMTNVPITPVTVGTNYVVLFPKSNPSAFFRLCYSP